MAKKVKDTDYLFISTYLHSRERDLLTAARMERMIEAPTAEEAAKVLTEIGYGEFNPSSERELSAVLASEQEKLFEDLYRFVPDKAVVDVFKVKYDYHNLKTLLKARAMGVDGGRLLLDAGRVSAQEMNRAVTEGDYNALPELLRAAAEEAGFNIRGAEIVDPEAFDGMDELEEQINNAKQLNPKLKLRGCLVTMFYNREVCRQGEEWLQNQRYPVFKTHIRRTEKADEVTFTNESLMEYSPRSGAARDYKAFVREYLEV